MPGGLRMQSGQRSGHDSKTSEGPAGRATETGPRQRADLSIGEEVAAASSPGPYLVSTADKNLGEMIIRRLRRWPRRFMACEGTAYSAGADSTSRQTTRPRPITSNPSARAKLDGALRAAKRGADLDAGTALISDPGLAIRLSQSANRGPVRMIPIKSARAPMAGAVVSGLPRRTLLLSGFLTQGQARRDATGGLDVRSDRRC